MKYAIMYGKIIPEDDENENCIFKEYGVYFDKRLEKDADNYVNMKNYSLQARGVLGEIYFKELIGDDENASP